MRVQSDFEIVLKNCGNFLYKKKNLGKFCLFKCESDSKVIVSPFLLRALEEILCMHTCT